MEKSLIYIIKKVARIEIIFLIFIIGILKVESIPNFKSIYLGNNFYYIITSESVTYYQNIEGTSNRGTIIYNFTDEQKITNEEGTQFISFSIYKDSPLIPHILVVKNYLYAIQETTYFCNLKLIDEIKGYPPKVYAYKCLDDNYCYNIFAFLNSGKEIKLFLYKNPSYNCEGFPVYNSYINYVASENFDCQFMQSPQNGEVLTCFYQIENDSKIEAKSFTIYTSSPQIEPVTGLTKSKENHGAKIIKSQLSTDGKKAFVCYINNDNNVYCLIYNIDENNWSDENIYLDNCKLEISSLNIEYLDNLNEYILYCFQSSTKYNLQKFDSIFAKKEDKENGVYDLSNTLVDCSEYYVSSLVHNTNNIKMFVNCNNNILNFDSTASKVIPLTTIISTSFPETTILTTLPETLILTTLPETKILTTLINFPLTTIITITTYPLIPTTVPDILNNPYIPSSRIDFSSNFEYINIIQEITDKKLNDIINNIDNALEDYDVGQTYEIFGEEYSIKISPINSKIHGNISTYINFSNCENILREVNGLNESNILTVYQIEIDNRNEQSLINNIGYAVFNEKKEKLNLAACEKELIEINYQINSSMINKTKIIYYQDKGIDIFDIEGVFFNDICYSYSEGDSDIIIEDRIKDIYQNYSVCEDNCNYIRINLTENIVSCKCSVKFDIASENKPPKLAKIIRDSFEDSNLAVVKCYDLVFKFENKLQNLGFWIFSILVFLHIPFFAHYIIYNISSIKKFIFSEMIKFNYFWKKNNPPKKKELIKNKKKPINIIKKNKKVSEKICEDISSETKMIKYNNKIISTNINNDNFIPKLFKFKTNNKKKLNKKVEIKNINGKALINKFNKKPLLLNKNYINKNKKKELNSTKNFPKIKIEKFKNVNEIKLSQKYYSLIQIDANKGGYKSKPINSDFILDNYDYDLAIKYDKRKFWRLFYICILAKENIINIIFFKTPLNIQSLRACLFIFCYSCDLAFNTIFYTKQNISDKYHYHGDNLFLFTMVNNLLQTIISSLAALLVVNIFQHMIDSRGPFEDVFKEEEKKMREIKNYKVDKKTKIEILEKIRKLSSRLKCKIIFFIILEFVTMLFFYYFVTAFCEVYNKTQKSWLYDFFTGFFISLLTEIVFSFFIVVCYIISIRYKIKFIYNISIFFYNL